MNFINFIAYNYYTVCGQIKGYNIVVNMMYFNGFHVNTMHSCGLLHTRCVQYKTSQHSCLESVRYVHCVCAAIAMLISSATVYVLLLFIIKDTTGFQEDNPIND